MNQIERAKKVTKLNTLDQNKNQNRY